ncbi:MAG: hypothetical protein ACOCXZ_00300 [Chloroflexota bacterium]
MNVSNGYTNLGRLYGECILYWMLENAIDLLEVDDVEMQEGSGLSDMEFNIGMNWLIEQRLLDPPLRQHLH